MMRFWNDKKGELFEFKCGVSHGGQHGVNGGVFLWDFYGYFFMVLWGDNEVNEKKKMYMNFLLVL